MRNALATTLIALSLWLAPFRAIAETRAGAPDDWPEPIVDSKLHYFVLGDQLEYRGNDGDDLERWDAEGWFGGDYHKLWFKAEGANQRLSAIRVVASTCLSSTRSPSSPQSACPYWSTPSSRDAGPSTAICSTT